MTDNEITQNIIGAAIEVHKNLGPGLLESVYEICLYKELVSKGFTVKRQLGLPVIYKGEKCDLGFRIDLLVENKVVIELKSVDALNDIHIAQLLTYLKLSELNLGLLINFNVTKLVDGVKRVVNNFEEE
ncbi:MAG: GxxExxY protein [Candidatus Neomarinimicrobiota bacterium]|nr:MAG: GxxExxY protein [Candidatus Neomarinimicrobiota bacterium]